MGIVGVIHTYPNMDIIQSLHGHLIHLFVPPKATLILDSTENVFIHEMELVENEQCINKICKVVEEYKIETFPPLYEGGILLSAVVSAKMSLKFYSISTTLGSRNKYYQKQVMQSYSVSVPNSVPVFEFTSYEYLKTCLGEKFVLKIVDSMNSQAVMLIRNEEEYVEKLAELFKYIKNPKISSMMDRNRFCYGNDDVKVIAQEFLDGKEVNLDLLVCRGNKYDLGVFEKNICICPFFPETMSFYPAQMEEELLAKIIECAGYACDALSIDNGVAHIEFRIKDGVPYLLDMGLRPGGAYTIRAVNEIYGLDYVRLIVDIFLNITIEQPKVINEIGIVYGGIVFRETGYIESINGINKLEVIPQIKEVCQLVEIGDYVVAPPYSAQPHLCYYYLSGDSIKSLKECHYKIQELIEVEVSGR